MRLVRLSAGLVGDCGDRGSPSFVGTCGAPPPGGTGGRCGISGDLVELAGGISSSDSDPAVSDWIAGGGNGTGRAISFSRC